MLWGNREVDNDFSPEENMYLRCLKDNVVDGKLLTVQTKFPENIPDTSFNRGKYSEEGDVLIPIYLDWGVAKIRIDSLPKTVDKQNSDGSKEPQEISFEHVPEPCNYAHSEIKVSAFGSDTPLEKISPGVKKTIRGEIAKAKVVIQPRIFKEEWKQHKQERRQLKEELEAKALEKK